MINDPQEAAAGGDAGELFVMEAAARLRIAVRMMKRSEEDPEEWGGGDQPGEYARYVAVELIEEVAEALEAYTKACEDAAKAGA